MPSKYIELKVGLLVIIGAIILVFALYLAKGYRYGQEFYSVSVVFPEIGALSTGDPVSVSGVGKGKVKNLQLFEGEVLVEMEISSDVVLKQDAEFVVKNIGLMGERFIAIRPGRSDSLLDLTTPGRGGFDAGIPEVMGMMGEAISNINNLVKILEKTAMSPETLDKFSETIKKLYEITSNLEDVSRHSIPKAEKAIDNFAVLSQDLKAGFNRNLPRVDTALSNFDKASQRVMTMLNDLEQASQRLNNFAADVEQSEGSLRLLLEDRRLYDDLRGTAQNLDSLVDDIRANPRKYINFTLEIF